VSFSWPCHSPGRISSEKQLGPDGYKLEAGARFLSARMPRRGDPSTRAARIQPDYLFSSMDDIRRAIVD
jgi:hypothetical protein